MSVKHPYTEADEPADNTPEMTAKQNRSDDFAWLIPDLGGEEW